VTKKLFPWYHTSCCHVQPILSSVFMKLLQKSFLYNTVCT